MSYAFHPQLNYRMPTHFGPSTGPRQKPGGGVYPSDKGQRATLVFATFEADRDQIAAVLPEGFEPADAADLTVEIKNMTNIGWLAGRGYSVATVTTAVRWLGGEAPEDGRFKLVLWENMADPIITGREELGYPKVFADIPDIALDGSAARASASWGGFTFLELAVEDLAEASSPPAAPTASYHLCYRPRIGAIGQPELVQTIVTPPGQGALAVVGRLSGSGSARFHSAGWEQLPTLINIVNGLADIRLGACRAAGLAHTTGSTDLRNQIIVAEAT